MIDIHTHLHPPGLFAAIKKWFAERTDWDLKYPTEPEAVLEILRQHGVERFVFCSYAHKPGIARGINEWLVQTSAQLGHVGLPLATVHPEDDDAEEYVQTAFENGCIGLKIHEDVQQLGIDDSRLEKILHIVANYNGLVLAHIGPIPWKVPPKESPQRVASVVKQFPKANFVIAHFGAPHVREYLHMMDQFSNLYLDTTMAFYFQDKLSQPIERAMFENYSERILFGSDFPVLPHDYDFEIKEIRALQLSEAVLQRVLHDNAAKLMHIQAQ